MTNDEFEKRLGEAGLTKIDFAALTGLNRASISNWKQDGKKPPSWTESWLNYYIDHKALKDVVDVVDSVKKKQQKKK